MDKKGSKTCFKTYKIICRQSKKAVSLPTLTKQHNLFYTLKKLIPIQMCDFVKSHTFFFIKAPANLLCAYFFLKTQPNTKHVPNTKKPQAIYSLEAFCGSYEIRTRGTVTRTSV